MAKLLVTGGAGYIGSHVLKQLISAGHEVLVYDNLSTGHKHALLGAPLIVGDLADRALLSEVFAQGNFAAVLHFAAHIVVPESVSNPLKYYNNNTRNTLQLLELCHEFGIERFIFSSTAAVYGIPETGQVNELSPLLPINPYGASKMMSERMLMDLSSASSLRHVILRYFNVAGADLQGELGQETPEATHLIKVACQAAIGIRQGMKVFGDDYATPDGTCIRDYIHIDDLARAHVAALHYLLQGGGSQIFNCGYGHGSSVAEVIRVVKQLSGVDFPVELDLRREGDPPKLIAANDKIKKILGWLPQNDDLELIISSALHWERVCADRDIK
ncbi:MAG: UDP-glucose 4-epimerase GalE [Deltaproteobacteria bacterium HGW-Deltaproteobacteria-4]|nr:MAG: UDP-glucose 4-epimerase GalE [Deltaproteobacteria bacterium HGW-Deltaproteobacteria-4]